MAAPGGARRQPLLLLLLGEGRARSGVCGEGCVPLRVWAARWSSEAWEVCGEGVSGGVEDYTGSGGLQSPGAAAGPGRGRARESSRTPRGPRVGSGWSLMAAHWGVGSSCRELDEGGSRFSDEGLVPPSGH